MIDDAIHIHNQKAIIMKFISITIDDTKIIDAHSRVDFLELIHDLDTKFNKGEINQYTILKELDCMPICGKKRSLPSRNIRAFRIDESQWNKQIDELDAEELNYIALCLKQKYGDKNG